jgi:hypothetical protein
MDGVFILPVIGLAFFVFGGVVLIWQSWNPNLENVWTKHAARYLAKGLHAERTPEWDQNMMRWMRIQWWLGIVCIIIFGGFIILYLYFLSTEGLLK